jgi:hypothetical protein
MVSESNGYSVKERVYLLALLALASIPLLLLSVVCCLLSHDLKKKLQ